MFIDETWVKTNMAPLRGWGTRGRRLKAYAPHGHWKTLTFIAGDSQEFCVRGRFSHHALTNLSSKMMANWVLALHHSRGGIFHVCATWRKTRYSNLIAASSVGKWPLLRHGAPQFGVQGFDGVRGVNDAPHSDGKGEERDDMLPVAPPALRDCRILAAPDAGVEILERPAGHVRVRRPVDRFELSADRLAVFP